MRNLWFAIGSLLLATAPAQAWDSTGIVAPRKTGSPDRCPAATMPYASAWLPEMLR